jgi:hypothetical protein
MRGPGRAAVAAAAALSTALLIGACSSSGGAAPSLTPSVGSTSSPSNPPTSASPTSVALPSPSSTATESHLHRPAGASQLSSHVCLDVIFKIGGIAQSMEIVFAGFKQGVPSVAVYNYGTIPRVEARDRAALPKLRQAWLRAGYPATFPTVRDIDAMINAADRLFAAARKKDITPLPQIYLDYNSALHQYENDANHALCPE